MIRKIFVLGVLLSLVGSVPAQGAIVKNLSTGINDATSQKLGNNLPDPDYVIASGGTGGRVGEIPVARQSPLATGWLDDSASTASRWIVLNSGDGAEGMSVATGTFRLQTTVDLTGYDPASAFLDSLRYAADNKLTAVRVNGTTVFSQSETAAEEFGSFTALPARLGEQLFTPGVNTISFEVFNSLPPPGLPTTPMGLRLEGSVTAAVPEPGVVVAAALGGLALLRRRRR